jgi:hypothetical protein
MNAENTEFYHRRRPERKIISRIEAGIYHEALESSSYIPPPSCMAKDNFAIPITPNHAENAFSFASNQKGDEGNRQGAAVRRQAKPSLDPPKKDFGLNQPENKSLLRGVCPNQ